MKNQIMMIAALMVALSFTACKKDDGNGDVNYKMQYRNAQFNAQKTANGSLNFTAGHVLIGDIEFEAETEDDAEFSQETSGEVKFDLVTGESTPALPAMTLPAGKYEEVSLEVDLVEDSAEPTILMTGIYTTTSGEERNIRFEYNSDLEFEVEAENVTIVDEAAPAMKINFDPSVWFAVITADQLDAAQVDSTNTIVISAESNEDLFDLIDESLDEATDAELDDD